MGQGEGPETQVGGSVGDGTEDELNRMNHLVNHHVTEIKGFFIVCLLNGRVRSTGESSTMLSSHHARLRQEHGGDSNDDADKEEPLDCRLPRKQLIHPLCTATPTGEQEHVDEDGRFQDGYGDGE